ncbi:738_t:CDS:2, partial [Entrophospora sp. SA101]
PFQKYKLKQNNVIFNMCKEFVKVEEEKIDSEEYDIMGNIEFGKALNVCEVISPLINIVMDDLPGGKEGSLASAMRKETGQLNSTLIKQIWDHKKQQLAIFTVNVAGDMLEIYAMHRETGILKYCLLEQVSILLHIAIPNDVHNIIHTLLTLRTGVACMLYKILHKYEGMLNKLRYEDVQRCIDGIDIGEDENEDNELSEVEGNLNNEIREGDEESDNGSNESDTTIELY